MEPLDFADLPEDALLLIDSAPIIYFLEGHPKFGPRFKPLFEAHGTGHLRFAVTTITIAEVLTGRCRRLMTHSRGVIVRSSNRGSRSRLTSTWRKALQDCGRRSASSWQRLFKRRARWQSTRPPW